MAHAKFSYKEYDIIAQSKMSICKQASKQASIGASDEGLRLIRLVHLNPEILV